MDSSKEYKKKLTFRFFLFINPLVIRLTVFLLFLFLDLSLLFSVAAIASLQLQGCFLINVTG